MWRTKSRRGSCLSPKACFAMHFPSFENKKISQQHSVSSQRIGSQKLSTVTTEFDCRFVDKRFKLSGSCVFFMLLHCLTCTIFEAALHVGLDRYKVVEHATTAQKREESKLLPSARTVAINCLWWSKNPFAVVGLSDCYTRIVDDVGRRIQGNRYRLHQLRVFGCHNVW